MEIFFLTVSAIFAVCLLAQKNRSEPEPKTPIKNHPQPSSPSDVTSSVVTVPPEPSVQKNAIISLILVVSEAQQILVESIKNKEMIDDNDGDALYAATHFLCYENDKQISSKWNDLKRFQAKEESEYDIYLIKVRLKQYDDRFDPDVNSLDRYDAFLKLSELANHVEVSPRLTMEVGEEFDFYSR